MQTFLVPEEHREAGGLFIAGGWHQFVGTPNGPVLTLPDAGDYSHLGALGFELVGSTPTHSPDAEDPAAD